MLRTAKYGRSGRRAAYRSYTTGRGRGLPAREGAADEEVEVDVRDTARVSSACSRGMKPGSMGVPPMTRMEDASVRRRSTGTCAGAAR